MHGGQPPLTGPDASWVTRRRRSARTTVARPSRRRRRRPQNGWTSIRMRSKWSCVAPREMTKR